MASVAEHRPPSREWLPWLLAVLVLVGVAARVRNYASSPSYWYDEAYLLQNIFSRGPAELLRPLADEQAAPPLFLLLLRALYVGLGPAEWVMRLPAFVASLAALALMAPLSWRFLGPRAGPWAVGLAAVCHHALTHGCEVKPYMLDLLSAEVILLAGLLVLPVDGSRRRRLFAGGLLLVGLLAPWFSYPSVFLLGGVSAALLLHAWRSRRRESWLLVGLFTAITFGSTFALWFFVARHQHSRYLEQFWAFAFPNLASWIGPLEPILLLMRIGDYGTTSMGVPLMLLSLLGFALLLRRSPERLALLLVPLALALAAGALHRYPLADRLLFFAVPCIWLAASAGMGFLVQLGTSYGRWGSTGALLLAAVVAPGAVRMTRHVVSPPEATPFREAFAHVYAHWRAGDRVWVSHPQVYEVYYGRTQCMLDIAEPLSNVANAVRQGRLWVVFAMPEPPGPYRPDLFACLQQCGSPCLAKQQGKRLEIDLYGRARE